MLRATRGPVSQPPSLRGRALMWLAQREHSRQELTQKLRRWVRFLERVSPAGPGAEDARPTTSAQDIETLLDTLQADGYLSDERFVESRVNARLARFGNRRIEQELQRHGAELDAPLRAQLRATEADRARRVWATRFGRAPVDATERARQMRFLAGRGFSADVIRSLVSGVDDEPTEPEH